ncbi:MAG: S41 family peptidase [Candidatus Gracilibacteria bacterium]|nr:S41 family peptidase [Candidatus Gracilibacteria bacterium]
MYQYYPPKKHHYFVYPLVIIISFVLGWQATSYGILGGNSAHEESPDTTENGDINSVKKLGENIDLDLFWTVWGEIASKYVDVDALNDDTMVYGAIKGMVNSLDDPYTVFMDPKESEDFSASLHGKLEGIGAELSVEDKNLVVVSPLRNSPAERAGILPGDIVYKIDDKLASDMTLFEAIMNIRGKQGTTVNLTIIRKNMSEPFDVSIVRDKIDIESVTVEKLDNGVVYLSVNQFNDNTERDFAKAISEMILNPPKGVIVDLRYNGGGFLDIAVDLLSHVLPTKSKAVEIRQKTGKGEMMYTNGNPKIVSTPLVVLVNEGSASASEIFAGAVQDLKRGIVMGTKTFGKGTVQEVETFKDGSSIRMTIAKWYTPAGRDVNKVGLIPDVIVELSDEDIEKKIDSQKESAIEYLVNLGR